MKMFRKLNFWDILAWVVLLGVLLWIILETLLVFEMSLWARFLPLLGVLYFASWQIHKLNSKKKKK